MTDSSNTGAISELKFHSDDEVLWKELHDPVLVLSQPNCLTCGHDGLDDRYHFFVGVSAYDGRNDEIARLLQIELHLRRTEMYKLTTDEMLTRIYEDVEGKPWPRVEHD